MLFRHKKNRKNEGEEEEAIPTRLLSFDVLFCACDIAFSLSCVVSFPTKLLMGNLQSEETSSKRETNSHICFSFEIAFGSKLTVCVFFLSSLCLCFAWSNERTHAKKKKNKPKLAVLVNPRTSFVAKRTASSKFLLCVHKKQKGRPFFVWVIGEPRILFFGCVCALPSCSLNLLGKPSCFFCSFSFLEFGKATWNNAYCVKRILVDRLFFLILSFSSFIGEQEKRQIESRLALFLFSFRLLCGRLWLYDFSLRSR